VDIIGEGEGRDSTQGGEEADGVVVDSGEEDDEEEEARRSSLNARLSSSAFGDGIVLQEAMDQQGVEEEEWERCELCAKYINAKLAKRRESDSTLLVDPELDALMKPQILAAFLEVMSQESLRPFGKIKTLSRSSSNNSNKYHSIADMTICFNFMYARNVLNETDRVIGSAPSDIVDGNKRKTLDLIWTIITRFQQAEVEAWERDHPMPWEGDAEGGAPDEMASAAAEQQAGNVSAGAGTGAGAGGSKAPVSPGDADEQERVLLQEVMESFGRQEARSRAGSTRSRAGSKQQEPYKGEAAADGEGGRAKKRNSGLTSVFGAANKQDQTMAAGGAPVDGTGEGDNAASDSASGGEGGGANATGTTAKSERRVNWGDIENGEKQNGRRRSWKKGDKKSAPNDEDDPPAAAAAAAAAAANAGVGKSFRSLRKGLARATGLSGVLSKKTSKPATSAQPAAAAAQPPVDTRTPEEKAKAAAAVEAIRSLTAQLAEDMIESAKIEIETASARPPVQSPNPSPSPRPVDGGSDGVAGPTATAEKAGAEAEAEDRRRASSIFEEEGEAETAEGDWAVTVNKKVAADEAWNSPAPPLAAPPPPGSAPPSNKGGMCSFSLFGACRS